MTCSDLSHGRHQRRWVTGRRIALFALSLAVLASPQPVSAQSLSDAGSCRADVVFLMDNTGSMYRPITATKRNASTILDAISGGDPRFAGIDTRYGVATYWGDPREYLAGMRRVYWCHRESCPWSWCSRYYCENPTGICRKYFDNIFDPDNVGVQATLSISTATWIRHRGIKDAHATV